MLKGTGWVGVSYTSGGLIKAPQSKLRRSQKRVGGLSHQFLEGLVLGGWKDGMFTYVHVLY